MNMNKKIEKINDSVYLVSADPGDMTHYEYLVYRDGPDDFTFAPTRSTFNYPQRLNSWDCKNLTEEELVTMAEEKNCNMFTLKECIRTMDSIIWL